MPFHNICSLVHIPTPAPQPGTQSKETQSLPNFLQRSSTKVHLNSLACQICISLPTPVNGGQKVQSGCISPVPQGR